MYHQIHTYPELQQQIHDDLRIQHPEWVKSNGECPTCDSYESRLTEMLGALKRTGSNATRRKLLVDTSTFVLLAAIILAPWFYRRTKS
jgi:hypothetical protein